MGNGHRKIEAGARGEKSVHLPYIMEILYTEVNNIDQSRRGQERLEAEKER